MTALDVAQQYFDAWNRRDPAAVLATMAEDGTYSDPGTGGPIRGQAFAAYMQGLFAAFPDVSFSSPAPASRRRTSWPRSGSCAAPTPDR